MESVGADPHRFALDQVAAAQAMIRLAKKRGRLVSPIIEEIAFANAFEAPAGSPSVEDATVARNSATAPSASDHMSTGAAGSARAAGTPVAGVFAASGRGSIGAMTDPIADMLTLLRNANSAYQNTVTMPYSKLKSHIAEILKAEGYVASWKVEDAPVGKHLTIELKFGPNRERSLAGIRRVSKPGLRVYAKSTNLPRVLGDLGMAILSTPSGLLTDKEAALKGVEGEVIAYIW